MTPHALLPHFHRLLQPVITALSEPKSKPCLITTQPANVPLALTFLAHSSFNSTSARSSTEPTLKHSSDRSDTGEKGRSWLIITGTEQEAEKITPRSPIFLSLIGHAYSDVNPFSTMGNPALSIVSSRRGPYCSTGHDSSSPDQPRVDGYGHVSPSSVAEDTSQTHLF